MIKTNKQINCKGECFFIVMRTMITSAKTTMVTSAKMTIVPSVKTTIVSRTKSTNTEIQIHKYKYTNKNTQIQIHKYK